MIFAESRGDFYPRSWSQIEFDTQFEILMDPQGYSGVTEEGFVSFSLVDRIIEFIKSFFGGTDHASEERVQAAAIKFLYYGETHHYVTDRHLYRLISLDPSSFLAQGIVKSFVQEMQVHHFQKSAESSSEFYGRLRGLVSDYHARNATTLRPGFWTRLTTRPSLDSKTLFSFGDAPLQLMKKVLEQEEPEPKVAFHFLKKAFDLKNDEEEFQEKLASSLEDLEETYAKELKGHSKKIQELWIELAQNAYQNQRSDLGRTYLARALKTDSSNVKGRLQVARTYLLNEEYTEALPFLAEVQRADGDNPEILSQIGHAYWQDGQYPQAVEAYQAALKCDEVENWTHSAKLELKALLNHRVGAAYLEDLLPADPGNGGKARKFLLSAVLLEPTKVEYQEDLCKAYEQHWQSDLEQFATSSLQDFFTFLTSVDASLFEKWESKFSKVLLDCAEHFFKKNDNSLAHACLEETLRLFPDREQLKIDILALALRYKDPKPLKTKFEHWNKENRSNPYLKMKIGDAYWETSKTAALKAYEEALALFSARMAATKDAKEKDAYKACMAEIEAKIGQDHLQTQPGFFGGNPHEKALERLEKAASLDPAHAAALHDAYLAAAQAEKQRFALLRDTNKIIGYYKKAFELLYKKGEYLIDLCSSV